MGIKASLLFAGTNNWLATYYYHGTRLYVFDCPMTLHESLEEPELAG